MAKSKKTSVNLPGFLKCTAVGAAASATALVTNLPTSEVQAQTQAAQGARGGATAADGTLQTMNNARSPATSA